MVALDKEQVEKLKRNWADKRDFNLLGVEGTEAYHSELSQFERETRYKVWEAEYLAARDIVVAEHAPQSLYYNGTDATAESLKRVSLPGGGWIYIHTMIARGFPGEKFDRNKPSTNLAMQTQLQYVPSVDVPVKQPGDYLEKVLAMFNGSFAALKDKLHSSPNLKEWKAGFTFAGIDPSEVDDWSEALEQVWKNYWGFKYAPAVKTGTKA